VKGKIVLVPFPFTDRTAAKLRPALVVHEGGEDIVVVSISSRVPSAPSDTDVLLTKRDPGFGKTGLKADSLIKLDKIATVLKDLVVGELGDLDQQWRDEVNRKLMELLRL